MRDGKRPWVPSSGASLPYRGQRGNKSAFGGPLECEQLPGLLAACRIMVGASHGSTRLSCPPRERYARYTKVCERYARYTKIFPACPRAMDLCPSRLCMAASARLCCPFPRREEFRKPLRLLTPGNYPCSWHSSFVSVELCWQDSAGVRQRGWRDQCSAWSVRCLVLIGSLQASTMQHTVPAAAAVPASYWHCAQLLSRRSDRPVWRDNSRHVFLGLFCRLFTASTTSSRRLQHVR